MFPCSTGLVGLLYFRYGLLLFSIFILPFLVASIVPLSQSQLPASYCQMFLLPCPPLTTHLFFFLINNNRSLFLKSQKHNTTTNSKTKNNRTYSIQNSYIQNRPTGGLLAFRSALYQENQHLGICWKRLLIFVVCVNDPSEPGCELFSLMPSSEFICILKLLPITMQNIQLI